MSQLDVLELGDATQAVDLGGRPVYAGATVVAGPPGEPGEPGPAGERGPAGADAAGANYDDLPAFDLVFENGLI